MSSSTTHYCIEIIENSEGILISLPIELGNIITLMNEESLSTSTIPSDSNNFIGPSSPSSIRIHSNHEEPMHSRGFRIELDSSPNIKLKKHSNIS
jgi:hypothetical protein